MLDVGLSRKNLLALAGVHRETRKHLSELMNVRKVTHQFNPSIRALVRTGIQFKFNRENGQADRLSFGGSHFYRIAPNSIGFIHERGCAATPHGRHRTECTSRSHILDKPLPLFSQQWEPNLPVAGDRDDGIDFTDLAKYFIHPSKLSDIVARVDMATFAKTDYFYTGGDNYLFRVQTDTVRTGRFVSASHFVRTRPLPTTVLESYESAREYTDVSTSSARIAEHLIQIGYYIDTKVLTIGIWIRDMETTPSSMLFRFGVNINTVTNTVTDAVYHTRDNAVVLPSFDRVDMRMILDIVDTARSQRMLTFGPIREYSNKDTVDRFRALFSLARRVVDLT